MNSHIYVIVGGTDMQIIPAWEISSDQKLNLELVAIISLFVVIFIDMIFSSSKCIFR